MNLIKKVLKIFSIFAFGYILVFFSTYIISGFLLLAKITPENKLIKHYQRNFYLNGGIRNIWQADKKCVEFDKDLIFVPKITSCKLKNIEFDTIVTFDKFGRYSEHPKAESGGIAVLGDSFAMGFGVNDNETFSALLENKINKPVYNLAVSGYGTIRELIRFEKSGLANSVDTVIIQYCYNDWDENNNFKNNSLEEAKEKFNMMTSGKPMGFFKKLRKSFRYSLQIPIEQIKKKEAMGFGHHEIKLIEILKKSHVLNNKRVILFYTNGYDMSFKDFPIKKSNKIKNLEFVDLELGEKHFFHIDGHLSPYGHKIASEKLFNILVK